MSEGSLKRKVEALEEKNKELTQQVKNKKKKEDRAQRRILNMKEVIEDFKSSKYIEQNTTIFDQFGSIPSEVFKRMQNNALRGNISKDKYPPELRCFALTLHFYSPAAYKYVRDTFELALPHPSQLRLWYNSVDAEPGFSEECFTALELKRVEYKQKNTKLICSLVIDELGIKKGVQRTRNGKVYGHVDIGGGTANNTNLTATNALVMLVVPLDGSWKLPIAFFLIQNLNGASTANLIQEALIRLHNVGVEVSSITLDGPPVHFTAVTMLGAVMSMSNDAKPYFPHPVENQPDVCVIVDACHDLKNIRSTLAEYKILIDGDGNKIQWQYLVALASLQEKDGLRLGNKLRLQHIEYKKMIMKVYLAAQTLSSSVADAIEFCWKILRLPEFKDCEATVKFIRCIDFLFDFLNVRNPWGNGCKSPLKKANEIIWRQRVLNEINYLSQLTLSNNTPIYLSPRKTGFIGFYTACLATIRIFDRYVKPDNGPLKYLLTYKLSQDHIELFFAAIRARSGWCPNPTALQFTSAYKRLLVRHDIQVATGNAQMMDQTKILNITPCRKKTIATLDRYDPNIYSSLDNVRVQEKYCLDRSSNSIAEDLKEFLDFSWAMPTNLTEFSIHAIGYIAGFVVKKLFSMIKCSKCLEGCRQQFTPVTSIHNSYSLKGLALVAQKNRGGLILPSDSVITICSYAESLFRKACNSNSGKPPVEMNFPALLAHSVFKNLLSSTKELFPELEQHFNDTFVLDSCTGHKYFLVKCILIYYIEIRMYSFTKNVSLSITGTQIRHFLTRQIVWAHQ